MAINKRYSDSGEQAAKVSLFAPVVALVLGFLTINNRQGGAGLFIAWTNLGLLTLGLLLGIFALTQIGAENGRRILVRAIIGILLNGFFVISFLFVLMTARSTVAMHDQMVGHWRVAGVSKNAKQTDVTYRADNTCELVQSLPDGHSGKMTGVWRLDPLSNQLVVTVLQSDGDASLKGKALAIGKVKSVDENDLVLDTGSGDQISHRVR